MKGTVTYSPGYTVVPTYECFNKCSYCNFRLDPGKGKYLKDTELLHTLQRLDRARVVEILVLSGEVHPASKRRTEWFTKIYNSCRLAINLGFLPHTNAGPLSWQEMEQLQQVNVSMGLMLEQLNSKFMDTVHRHAPSKEPQLRLQQLEWAGKLKIPFTTGLLLGIGETESDLVDSLQAIALVQRRWGHIQEIILQPHSVGSSQAASTMTSFDPQKLPATIALAKNILPEEVTIQIPPNLVPEPNFLLACLEAGARDLGGLSPIDEVNPDYLHPTPESLVKVLQPAGWNLKPRLPVYPQYYSWLSPSLQQAIIRKKKILFDKPRIL
ncbi:MAG: 7,8-didemethyl-8-hydroxy-5-deazariboflavin synthase subunit CofG [Cyanobacteria bacterium J06621_8]